jgi:hypothetical protein
MRISKQAAHPFISRTELTEKICFSLRVVINSDEKWNGRNFVLHPCVVSRIQSLLIRHF